LIINIHVLIVAEMEDGKMALHHHEYSCSSPGHFTLPGSPVTSAPPLLQRLLEQMLGAEDLPGGASWDGRSSPPVLLALPSDLDLPDNLPIVLDPPNNMDFSPGDSDKDCKAGDDGRGLPAEAAALLDPLSQGTYWRIVSGQGGSSRGGMKVTLVRGGGVQGRKKRKRSEEDFPVGGDKEEKTEEMDDNSNIYEDTEVMEDPLEMLVHQEESDMKNITVGHIRGGLRGRSVWLDGQTGCLVSNDLSDCVKARCALCHETFPFNSLRQHTKKRHDMTITTYKQQHAVEPVERVLHRCGVCGTLLLMDSDALAKHLKAKDHPKITHREYNEKYMVNSSKKMS
jgi:hypothetical protein